MHEVENYIPMFLIPFIGWGVRRHLISNGDFTRLKKTTLAIGLSAYFVTEMARSFYRPYIYANDIGDWFIADTIGNSLGTITAVFMILTMAGRGTGWDWRLVWMVLVGLLGYEGINLLSGHPLDLNDVLATVLFGALSIMMYSQILRRATRSE